MNSSTASIKIHGVRAGYRPGTSLSGSVEWNAHTAPHSISIKLFWVTSGAASRQIGVVRTCVIERPNPTGTSHFEFRLPEGPWSFEGALVSLAWVVEAVLAPSKQSAHVIFSMSPENWQFELYPRQEASESSEL
jgi:hypothetical protein